MSMLVKFTAAPVADVEDLADTKFHLLDEELRPKHGGYLTHAEKMEIARAVMRKNRNVLAALAK